jgi:hypothetical protein
VALVLVLIAKTAVIIMIAEHVKCVTQLVRTGFVKMQPQEQTQRMSATQQTAELVLAMEEHAEYIMMGLNIIVLHAVIVMIMMLLVKSVLLQYLIHICAIVLGHALVT